jgi:hypothetical protein
MLRMLEARQKALREAASQTQADLAQLSEQAASTTGQASEQAQQHLGQAVQDMGDFEGRLADARYESAMPAQEKQAMAALADSAGRQLHEAGRAIKQGLTAGKPSSAAEQAQEMAEQLAEDAEALDESLSPADRQRMLERLEAARRLLENQAGPQWANVSRSDGQTNSALVYTHGGPLSPAEIARMMAQQFWSMAIEARRREMQPVTQEPSDAQFFEAEKEFFEKAAQFQAGE